MPQTLAPAVRQYVGPRTTQAWRRIFCFSIFAAVAQLIYTLSPLRTTFRREFGNDQINADRAKLLSKCSTIHVPAGPPADYATSSRLHSGSDRWVPGTPPTLLRNAKIWTGARNGTEIVYGDILLDKGLIVAVGYIPPSLISATTGAGSEMRVQDVGGKWITPGLVDLHSHIGVYSSPSLSGMC